MVPGSPTITLSCGLMLSDRLSYAFKSSTRPSQALAVFGVFHHDGRMVRDRALTPADLVGKLDTLRVACTKSDRAGRYPIARLIETNRPKCEHG